MKSTDFGGSSVAGGWESEATLKTSVLLLSAAVGDIHNSKISDLFKSKVNCRGFLTGNLLQVLRARNP